MKYKYKGKTFDFTEEKIEFIEKTEFYLDRKHAKTLKVVRCHQKLNNGLNGLYGYWEEKDWPELTEGYRAVPHLPNYGVNVDGNIIRSVLNTTTAMEVRSLIKYPSVSVWIPWIYSPNGTLGRSYTYYVHRLVAYCWVKNPKPEAYFIVRHLNDDNTDYSVDNLAWGDHYLNVQDALNNFKHPNSKTCIVRHCKSHKVSVFGSIGQFARHIKCSHESILVHTKVGNGRPYKGIWEIKLESVSNLKNIKWKHNKPLTERKSPLTYTCEGVSFSSSKSLLEHYGLEHKAGNPVKHYVSIMMSTLGLKVRVKDNRPKSIAIECYDHDKGKVAKYATITQAEKLCGINFGTIKKLIAKGDKFKKKGYSFRYETKEPWPKKFVDLTYGIVSVVMTDKDGNKFNFNSVKDAYKRTGINEKAVSKHLKSGEPYRGMTFSSHIKTIQ